jgi:hypothetical protein
MELVEFNGWKNNVRLSNEQIEMIITRDVGPRIIRFGFIGGPNMFAEIEGQQGGSGEDEWLIRGGHRLWIAPEEKPKTYELDNGPIEIEEIPGGARTIQPVGTLSGIRKIMEITFSDTSNRVTIDHILENMSDRQVEGAPWALTAMALNGTAVIPLPDRIAHTDRLTHNQEWSLWGYTDFSDPRWTLGSRYILFRQDPKRGPNKLGIAHSEKWVAYVLSGNMFVKRFDRIEGACYPDGGMNFETFSNEEFLEVESLGVLTTLEPGATAKHREVWSLHRDVKLGESEEDIDTNVRALAL